MKQDELAGRFGVAVTVACAILVTTTMLALVSPSVRAFVGLTAQRDSSGYALGDRIDVTPDVYGHTGRTVILFGRFDCDACRQAKPFLTKVVADLRLQPDVRVVLVSSFRNPKEQVDYAGDLGIPASDVFHVDFKNLQVKTIPAVVVVDHSGRVVYARAGVTLAQSEADIIRGVTLQTGR